MDVFDEMFGMPESAMRCGVCGVQWSRDHRCLDLPALTFNKDEWRMSGAQFEPPAFWGTSELGSLEQIMERLEREDDIMAATREIARSG